MSSDELKNQNPPHSPFELKLTSLSAHPSRIDRDQLMFVAGQAALRKSAAVGRFWSNGFWPAATAAMTVVASVLGVLLVTQGAHQQPEQIASTPAQESPVAPQVTVTAKDQPPQAMVTVDMATDDAESGMAGSSQNYLRLRNEVLEHGLDALPVYQGTRSALQLDSPETPRQQLKRLLDELPG